MKKFATLMLTLVMLISCAAIGMAEDITLDVIICQYGTQTNDWFTGTGMNGTSFVKKFEEANPGIKLNLEVVSWNDVYTVVSTSIWTPSRITPTRVCSCRSRIIARKSCLTTSSRPSSRSL